MTLTVKWERRNIDITRGNLTSLLLFLSGESKCFLTFSTSRILGRNARSTVEARGQDRTNLFQIRKLYLEKQLQLKSLPNYLNAFVSYVNI